MSFSQEYPRSDEAGMLRGVGDRASAFRAQMVPTVGGGSRWGSQRPQLEADIEQAREDLPEDLEEQARAAAGGITN